MVAFLYKVALINRNRGDHKKLWTETDMMSPFKWVYREVISPQLALIWNHVPPDQPNVFHSSQTPEGIYRKYLVTLNISLCSPASHWAFSVGVDNTKYQVWFRSDTNKFRTNIANVDTNIFFIMTTQDSFLKASNKYMYFINLKWKCTLTHIQNCYCIW